VFKARGQAFLGDLQATADAAIHIDPGSLSGKAVLCLPPVVAAVSTAADNMKASVSASGSVYAAVGGT
jgi:hypothetical protein